MPWDEETQEFIYAERPNKTLIKRELEGLQALIKRIIALPQVHFDEVPMSDDMREQFVLARRIERGALNRHIRYMSGRIHEEDMDAMVAVMDRQGLPQKAAVERLHRVEGWRDKLIAGDNALLTELVNTLPGCDVQYLRQMVRNANKEAKAKKSPKSARLLFKYLNELDEQQDKG
ncbi:ribosome biogenesis factor YjgA [Leucothrix pacifica]|uniref:Dual-action ribosomal maturation protein DarP n=1 Tax=Leucothrix pacifica TaxID=1247513 RepID=A0A317CD41_9GAMM|nr:ribosome biogenesis factor YjgA [Leucothrix pacifica]PWQ96456.1 DUF615 domain-containing protein [Leucothrix pacifica]